MKVDVTKLRELAEKEQKKQKEELKRQDQQNKIIEKELAEWGKKQYAEMKDREQKKYEAIIAGISSKTEQAAKQGKRTCVIMEGETLDYQKAEYRWFSKEISPKILPELAQRVFAYCKKEGLKPVIDFQEGMVRAMNPIYGNHSKPGTFSIRIRW